MGVHRCQKCGSTADFDGRFAVCPKCRKTLANEIRTLSMTAFVILVLSIVLASTSIFPFTAAYMRGNDASPFSMRSGSRSMRATPRGLFLLAFGFVATGFVLFVVSGIFKHRMQRKEDEYEKLTGERLEHSVKEKVIQ